ncbi:MAG: bis(5'-nucleosyl)-tetraphosphatase (symmetrical) YqeK [Eubacteriaceae bacterium]|nr:bis(5'-nucleosyl)-tetraphosphatase (symmetrical) YqeK [Eubacteriaceae bacterium]
MNMDSINKTITDYISRNFSEKRKIHTEGVRTTAIKLSEMYGADSEKAELAALFHDMFRGVQVDVINYYVKHLGLDKKYIGNPNLAHSKIAALIMERDYDIHDSDIINAVSYHTTGRPGMSVLEKVIYLADAIEPNRNYPGIEELRRVAQSDLDRAVMMSLERTIEYVTQQGNFLDEDTIKARDYYLKEKSINDEQ